MDAFFVCIGAVTPIVLLMAAGYVCRLAGIVQREDVPRFNKVAFTVFLSTLIFNSIYTSDFSVSFKPRLLLFVAVVALVLFGLSLIVALRLAKQRNQKGVICQALFRSNFLMLGLQFASSLVPSNEMGTVAMLCVVIIPIYNVLAVIVLSIYGGERVSWGQTVLRILKNPLIIATILAIIVVLLGIRFPAPIETTISLAAKVATPLMLFLLGAFFRFDSLAQSWLQVGVVCFLRLIVWPVLALGAAIALGFSGTDLVALIAVFGSATAIASFTMAEQMGGDAELAANLVVGTSVLCPVTLFAISLVCMSLNLI